MTGQNFIDFYHTFGSFMHIVPASQFVMFNDLIVSQGTIIDQNLQNSRLYHILPRSEQERVFHSLLKHSISSYFFSYNFYTVAGCICIRLLISYYLV
jgi:hypothetical protein